MTNLFYDQMKPKPNEQKICFEGIAHVFFFGLVSQIS